MTDFQQKLTLSVIDKLVFGLLILLAGFVLNRTLENYKSDQATKSEIARLRVAGVANVWTELSKQQRYFDELDPALAYLTYWLPKPARVQPHKKVFRRYSEISDALRGFDRSERTVANLLRENRFWIGEDLYPTYRDYVTRQHALAVAYENFLFTKKGSVAGYNKELRRIRERKRELLDARSDVFSVMADLQ